MRVLLVRHARAGDRGAWTGDDRLRPLDREGRRQANALAETLAGLHATRLLSSPYARCIQTLEPAVARLGLELEERDELAEGATAGDLVRLLGELDGAVPALCTHRDVIEALLGPQRACKKGAAWVLEVRGADVRAERYLPPVA